MKTKQLFVFLPYAMMFLVLFSCKADPPLEDRIAEAKFSDDIGTIMLTTCAIDGCHVGEAAPDNLDLSSWSAAFEGSDFGTVIIPGIPQWSHLFQHINTFEDLGIRATPTMPEEVEDRLDRSEVMSVMDWITDGAKDRNGSNYWATQETSSSGKLFTLCAGSDLVAVTDIQSNLIMRFISVGQNPASLEAPHFLALSPDEQFLYITLIEGNAIEKYRTDNYEFVGRVTLGSNPALAVISADGTRAIVTHYNTSNNSPKLSMIDTETMTLIEAVNGGPDFLGFAHGLKVNSTFTQLYVGVGATDEFAVIEIDGTGFQSVEETYSVDPTGTFPSETYKPYQLYLLENENLLFISCINSNEVRVFNTETGELLKVIAVAKTPRLMDYDPVSNRLFVACRLEEAPSEQGSLEGCISVIDVASLSWIQNIYRVGQRPHGVSVDPLDGRLYISSENTGGLDTLHHPLEGNTAPPGKYNVVDLSTLEVLRDLETEVAEYPNALVVTK